MNHNISPWVHLQHNMIKQANRSVNKLTYLANDVLTRAALPPGTTPSKTLCSAWERS
ncbi:hypothetical protein ABIC74_000780 [Mucilaginibacter rubeus]